MVDGKKVASLRHEHKWTQADLAQRAGIRQQLVSDIERGRSTNPKVASVQQLAQALGVVTTDLLVAVNR